jgi:ABC-type transport system involved in multi-copper enzyme maturation permease subunit
MSALRIPEFPLLRRELTELAQRKRTYVLRCIGAVILLAIAVLVYSSALSQATRFSQANLAQFGGNAQLAAQQFGIGGVVFQRIMPFLFWTVDLLMPALCCAAITSEKEKNTLGNLFLTRLSPMMLLAEKMTSRLVPMLTLLLLTFPILAFVYSLGGVDTTLLVGSLWLLLCECLLFASIGMMCSAWFPTTVSAFVWSYVIVGVLLVLTNSVGMSIRTPSSVWYEMQQYGYYGNIPLVNFMNPAARANTAGWMLLGVNVPALLRTVAASIPALLATAVFFMTGRLFLIRRAFVSSSSFLLKVFRAVDHFFVKLNDATTGVELIPDRNVLPSDDAVAWRERTKKSLGKARYLFRILVLMEGPTLFICVLAAIASSGSAFSGLRSLLAILWVMTAIIVCVKGAILISSEFARETIAPLLSTPLTSAEILQQKIVGMRRLLLVLAVPILSVNATMLLLHVDVSGATRTGLWGIGQRVLGYGTGCVLTVGIVMHVIAWLSALIGMASQRPTRSILMAVIACASLTIVPLVLDYLLFGRSLLELRRLELPVLGFLSPATLIASVEAWLISVSPQDYYWRMRGGGSTPFTTVTTFATAGVAVVVQTMLFLGLRYAALHFAPAMLNRREQTVHTPVSGVPTAETRFAT